MKAKKQVPMTLKVKFTLLTIFMMVITSAVLMIAINYDIKKTLPKAFDGIVVEEIDPASIGIEYKDYIINSPIVMEEENITIESVLNGATTNIYTTSIKAFILIIILGAVAAYFAVRHALRPLEQLNAKIKEVNENNLDEMLDTTGPKNEITDLSVSFNKMSAKLNQAFSSQKHFNSRIAHELKTPLTVIHTNIDILEQGPATTKDYSATFDVIKKAVIKMDMMVETLLDLVRLENNPLNDYVSINEVVNDAAQDLEILAQKKQIILRIFTEQLKGSIKGNQILLYRAFYNLIENSIKYNHEQGTITIQGNEDKEWIYVQISDTGIGIEEKDFNKIFDPFYRCNPINLSEVKGLGLGLSFVKSAIDMHGGKIEMESQKGKGTKFRILLPKL